MQTCFQNASYLYRPGTGDMRVLLVKKVNGEQEYLINLQYHYMYQGMVGKILLVKEEDYCK
jgi:hypothetical protein